MQRSLLAVGVAALAGAPGASILAAQEARQQDQAAVTVPAYTDQQRWNRAGYLNASALAVGIAYAKVRGQSAEDFGRFAGDAFASGWGPPNSGHAVRMARGINFNFAALSGSESQIVTASDTAASVRFKRSYVPYFGAQGQMVGVTVDEYERALWALHQRIAAHLGLRVEKRVEGDWQVITVTGRGSAAVTDFPRATYNVTFSQEDVGARPELAGTWEVSYGPDGRYTVRQNGEPRVQGSYSLRLDEIALRDETGPLACPGPATYRWTVNARGELVLGRLSDACEGRTRFITTSALSRK
ncbi:MAG: hypothetical protein M3282_11520 [Gemmatimonadota bacterium]|nr:hypothetical protein [Gemmatimonadota bacterium]